MSRTREYIFQLLTVTLVGVLIYQSWVVPRSIERPSPAAQASTEASSLQEHLLRVQGRLLVGAKAFIDELIEKQRQVSGTEPSKESLVAQQTLQHSLRQILEAGHQQSSSEETTTQPSGSLDSSARALQRKRLVLAHYFGLTDLSQRWLTELESAPDRSLREQKIDGIIAAIIKAPLDPMVAHFDSSETPQRSVTTLDSEEEKLIREELGWFGDLLLIRISGSAPTDERVSATLSEARTTFLKFVTGATVVAFVLVVGLCAFIFFALRFYRGKSVMRLPEPRMHPAWTLEIFAIYLLGMFSLSSILSLAGPMLAPLLKPLGPSGMLVMNAVGITSLSVLILWPVAFGNRWADVRQTIGLYSGTFRQFLSNIIVAPFFYLASWVVLLVVFFLYSIIINLLGVDLTQGTHPVVPMLLAADDPAVRIWIALLAVVVAPFIEEIMFRGALYTWLRSKVGRAAGMLLCSLIFASVHPQGALGVVPLTSVSIVLCMLREWRHSLVAPMIAHGCFNAGTLILVHLVLG